MNRFQNDLTGNHDIRVSKENSCNSQQSYQFLDKCAMKPDDITGANAVLLKTIGEVEKIALKPEFEVDQAVQTVEEFILAEVPVKAKAFVLLRLMGEYIRLSLGRKQLIAILESLQGKNQVKQN